LGLLLFFKHWLYNRPNTSPIVHYDYKRTNDVDVF
jgi:hypothetical protein